MTPNHLLRGLAFLTALLLLIGARAAWAVPPLPVRVAVFDDPLYVDTVSVAPNAESDNVQAALTSLGFSVTTFTGTNEASWRVGIANADVVLVPELEVADLAAAMDENAEQALVDFAGAGGTVIVLGGPLNRGVLLINAVFNFAIGTAVPAASTLQDGFTVGTRFAYGPPTLPANNGSIAASGMAGMYNTAAVTVMVGRAPVGAGRVIYLAWDWFNAAPVGVDDGGWNEVLRRAVLEGRPPQRRVGVYADAAYVDTASPAPQAEAVNVQASLVRLDMLVTRFAGTALQSLGAPRRPDIDALVFPELSGDLGAAMNEQARALVRDYVGAGGQLIVMGGLQSNANPTAFLNQVFGFSTAPQAVGTTTSTRTNDVADTLYGSGAAILTHFGANGGITGLPPGSRSIYVSGAATTVAVIPFGEGFIHYIGWNWLNAVPIGANDGSWLDVLERAVRTQRPPRRVALFANETFVDAIESPVSGLVSAEGVGLAASLVSRGHVVKPFSATDRAGWTRALADADVLAIPDLENLGVLQTALDAATRADVARFVRNGGLLVMTPNGTGRAAAFANSVFGTALVESATTGASTLSDFASGTPFSTGSPTLPLLNLTVSVSGGILFPVYQTTGGAVTVGRVPYGAGEILLLCWDFFDAAPAGGTQGAAWIDVLDLGVQAARPRTRHVAVFADEDYVSTLSPVPSPEAETLPAALELFDHPVREISGTSDATFRAALAGADTLLIPKLHVATLAPALSNGVRGQLREFVAAGGELIVIGDPGTRAAELLNAVFGWQVAQQPASGTLLGGLLLGTRFAASPTLSGPPVTELVTAGLPFGAKTVYADDGGDGSSVLEIPYGKGHVIYLGWTFTAPSLGLLNRPWLDVLDRAVQETGPRSRNVWLYADGGYVDTTPSGEMRNVYQTLEALDQSSTAFFEVYESEWSSAVARSQAMFLPELEGPSDLNADIPLASQTPQFVRDFVARGGTLLASQTFGGETDRLLNRIFGFSLAIGQQFDDGTPLARHGAAQGTAFATGPAELRALDATFATTSLPPGAIPLYEGPFGAAVVAIPYGTGHVVVLGWDFFGLPPYGRSDFGQAAWFEVVRRALELAPPDARHVAVFDDPAVVDTNGMPTAESDAVQAALLEKRHAVVPFTGTSLPAWSNALARADVVLVPEQQNALLAPLLDEATRNVVRSFVDAGGNLLAQGGGAAELVNALYGTAIAIDPTTDAQSQRYSPADFGTAFSGGLSPLGALAGGKGWQGLPSDGRAIYRSIDASNPFTVLWLPRGYGRVVMTGFPWYNVVPLGPTQDGGWNDVLDRAVREGAGGDPDEDGVALGDVCPLTADPLQLDGDADGAGDACDNCVAVANARMTPSDVSFLALNGWATLTGAQRDDDVDGYGNRCDAKFPFAAGALVGAPDLVQLRASLGKSRIGDTCGSDANLPCAIFDLDEIVTTVSAGDVSRFRTRVGKLPGPRCTSCPLPCNMGATGSCQKPALPD